MNTPPLPSQRAQTRIRKRKLLEDLRAGRLDPWDVLCPIGRAGRK